MARVCIVNNAKRTMRSVTMTQFNDFIEALKTGDVTHLTTILEMSIANVLNSGEIKAAQQLIKGFIAAAKNKDEYSIITTEDLRTIYHILSEVYPRIPPQQWVKNLRAEGIEKARYRPVNDTYGNPKNGIKITWKFDSIEEGESLIDQYFEKHDKEKLLNETN
jgi:hypothetical protein